MNNNLIARRSHHWLNQDQRKEVRNLLNSGSRAEELAVKFDVHFNTIRNIARETLADQKASIPPPPFHGIELSKSPITAETEEKASGPPPPCHRIELTKPPMTAEMEEKASGPPPPFHGIELGRSPITAEMEEGLGEEVPEATKTEISLPTTKNQQPQTPGTPNRGTEEPKTDESTRPPSHLTLSTSDSPAPRTSENTSHLELSTPHSESPAPRTEYSAPRTSETTSHLALSTSHSESPTTNNQKPTTPEAQK